MRAQPALIATLLLVACNGGTKLTGGGLARQVALGHDSPKDPAPPPTSPATEDEQQPADQPMQVSGAFLAACGHALTAPTGAFGCAVLDQGKAKAADVTGVTVKVTRADGTVDTPAVAPATPESPFHVTFSYDEDQWRSVTGVSVAATHAGQSVAASDTRLAYDQSATDAPNGRYLSRVYLALYGRLPTAAEATVIGQAFAAQAPTEAGRIAVTTALARSQEGLTHLLAEQAKLLWGTKSSVRDLMGDATIKLEAAELTGGNLKPVDALAGLMAAPAMDAAAGGTSHDWARRLYVVFLERPTDDDPAIDGWAGTVDDVGRLSAAKRFLASPEASAATVARAARTLLRRPGTLIDLEKDPQVSAYAAGNDAFAPEMPATAVGTDEFFALDAY